MNDKRKTVLIIGGSSGGHLFPAISLAEELKHSYNADIIFVLNSKAKLLMSNIPPLDFKFIVLPNIKVSFNILHLLKALIKSFKIISFYKPDVIVGFGSAISFPLITAGWIRSVPTFIHEQNATFGLANKILRHFAKKIALSFPISEKNVHPKCLYTGNLIRSELINEVIRKDDNASGKKSKKANILILGGSQGAHFINDITLRMFELLNEEQKSLFCVHHMIGNTENRTFYEARYEKLGLEYTLFRFEFNIGVLYKKADLVISRAGAGCIFEIMAFGLPSILIPYQYARAHQKANAAYLERNKASYIIKQEDCTPELLRESFLLFLSDHDYRKSIGDNCKSLSKLNATEDTAHAVMMLCE